MPPSRYRIVEQGRRLVVIDTQAGEPPVRPVVSPLPEMPGGERRKRQAPRAAPRPMGSSARPEPRGRYAGGDGTRFTTARWFDNDGPRTISINQDGKTQLLTVGIVLFGVGAILVALFQWVLLFPLAFVLLNVKVRGGLRTAATTWLTALDSSEG